MLLIWNCAWFFINLLFNYISLFIIYLFILTVCRCLQCSGSLPFHLHYCWKSSYLGDFILFFFILRYLYLRSYQTDYLWHLIRVLNEWFLLSDREKQRKWFYVAFIWRHRYTVVNTREKVCTFHNSFSWLLHRNQVSDPWLRCFF